MDRKRRLLKRVLLVSGGSALLFFAGYVIMMKRSPRQYYLPEGFHGWVTIRFEREGSPPLEKKDGAYQVYIPESGILETSSELQTGWARDAFFRKKGGQWEELPLNVDGESEKKRFIHSREDAEPNHLLMIRNLPEAADTVLWDGTRISKSGNMVDVRTGRKLLEHFWVSEVPEPFFYQHDSLPESRTLWPE
jgi:hypothetical protein